jgi:hypothetical protein
MADSPSSLEYPFAAYAEGYHNPAPSPGWPLVLERFLGFFGIVANLRAYTVNEYHRKGELATM